MELNNEIEDKEISIKDLISTLLKHKIMLLLITFVTAILIILTFTFAITPSQKGYSTKVSMYFAGIESQTLPSGNLYNYNEIISETNLKNLNLLDDSLIEQMKTNNDISITQTKDENDGKIEYEYNINVRGSYFKDSFEAEKFLTDLKSSLYLMIINDISSISYTTQFNVIDPIASYVTQLSIISDQIEYISESYTDLIEKLAELKIVSNQLLAEQSNFNNFVSKNTVESLENELVSANYINTLDPNFKVGIIAKRDSLQKLIADKTAERQILFDLIKSSELAGASPEELHPYHAQTAELTTEIAAMQIEVNNLNTVILLNDPDTATPEYIQSKKNFEIRITDTYNEVKKYTESLEDVVHTVYKNSLIFESNKVSSGGTSIVLVTGAAFVLAFGFAVVVVITIDYVKKNKDKFIKSK